MRADIGMIGLAVMGENMVMNMESKGYTVAVYNNELERMYEFMEGRARGKKFIGCRTLKELVRQLKTPRLVMLLIRAGGPVDSVVEQLLPLLEPGDVIIDGGNSHFSDTQRRIEKVEAQGMYYIGMGVSGGESGALRGPSLMPGGSKAAWPLVKTLFQAISAKVDGEPCCDWVGEGGAGHFVKMVHNGIEYGDMQLICEAYQLMRDGISMTNAQIADVFSDWNGRELSSYLIEITANILNYTDEKGEQTLEHILDTAGQKGTGKWTAMAALDAGMPLTLIGEAVFARCLSAMKDERIAAAGKLQGPTAHIDLDQEAFLRDLMDALYASKIVSYAQGYQLMRAAAAEHGWTLNFGGIALMWRGGCIIRSRFLGSIKEAYMRDPQLANLLMDDYFAETIGHAQAGWRRICAQAAALGIAVPSMFAALAYYDGYRCERSPAYLLQAQRDYFGAHTYERTDAPRGEFFHTDWTGEGGATASGAYSV